jgi:hypothetical protein
MSQGSSPPALEWPRWQWRFSKFVDLADVASIALGFMLFLCPSLVGERRFVIGIPLMSVPVSIPALVWVCRIGYITWLRARHYPRLYRSARRDSEALAQANRQIYALVERDINGRAFEIAGASWVRSRLCIALKKREDYKLAEGDMLVVIHLDDAMPMGWFEVIYVVTSTTLMAYAV